MADAADCKRCSLKSRCFYRKNTKRRSLDVPMGTEETNLSKAMLEKVDSEKGRKIYPQRIAIVEPIYANIRTHKRLDRFTLRGKIKVNIQWMLYCMVHNIEKIMNYTWLNFHFKAGLRTEKSTSCGLSLNCLAGFCEPVLLMNMGDPDNCEYRGSNHHYDS